MEILVVDDNPLIHELLPAVLARAFGAEARVTAARDLEEAFRHLAHNPPPALALLDLGLPGHAGLETLRRFRWKFPGVPVVVLSATEDDASIRVARSLGVSGYLPKSLSAERMVEALQKIGTGKTFFPT
ncbi:MAG TPA: response regulator transcription factor [Burkholderiales bacterium]|nr:response regulator transcription factor [Burkholderiales bacterium]